MSHNVSRHKAEQAQKRKEAAEAAARAPEQRRRLRRDKQNVAIWNALVGTGRDPSAVPTIRAAVSAGCPWLRAQCPACCQVGEVDLRQVDRHPLATISCLIPSLSCSGCRPNAPLARLTALARLSIKDELVHERIERGASSLKQGA